MKKVNILVMETDSSVQELYLNGLQESPIGDKCCLVIAETAQAAIETARHSDVAVAVLDNGNLEKEGDAMDLVERLRMHTPLIKIISTAHGSVHDGYCASRVTRSVPQKNKVMEQIISLLS